MIPRKMLKMRLTLGYSQEKLGEILGFHRDTIRNWETGKTPAPINVYSELVGMCRERKKAEKIQQIKMAACDEAA
jgi:DNA-binding XRE family transcriptional regulator